MRRRNLNFSLVGRLIIYSWVSAGVAVSPNYNLGVHTPPVQLVQRRVQQFMRKYRIPGAAVALYIDNTPYIFHFGYANRERKLPVTRTTLFEIGSVSKVFTCILIAQEILAQRMRLHDAISDYIPGLKHNGRLKHMTIEKLCTHTAALPFDTPALKNKEALVQHMLKWRPLSRTLTYHYSNPGIELLRIALEELNQQSINQLFRARILEPLNMTAIGVIVPDNYKINYAKCYNKAGQLTHYWDRERPLLLGAGGLRATSVDMLNFVQAALGLPSTPLSLQQAIQLTQTPHLQMGYLKHGLGWTIDHLHNYQRIGSAGGRVTAPIPPTQRFFNGAYLFDKTGTTNGFQAYIGVVPDQQIGMAIMVNKRLPQGWKTIKRFGKNLLRQLVK